MSSTCSLREKNHSMTKDEKVNLSVCEKSMTVMLSILKISAVSLSHLTVNQLGVHGNGKVRPAGEFAVGSPLLKPVKAISKQPAYLMEPDIVEKPRALSVDRVKPVEADLNKRSSDFIQHMRRKISSNMDPEAGDHVPRKATRPTIKMNQKLRMPSAYL